MFSVSPFCKMSDYRDSEDLYTIVSAYNTSTNSRPAEKQQSMVQSKTSGRKRSWAGAISPSVQGDDKAPASTKKICLDNEIHIWTERARRSKMNSMLNTLKSLLPADLHSKVDKGRIVDEAIDYIKTLQANLKDLQAQKSEMEAHHSRSSLSLTKSEDSHGLHIPPVPVASSYPGLKILGSNVMGSHAFITVWGPYKTGFLPNLFSILDANQLEIVSCTINTVGSNIVYALHAMSQNNNQQVATKALNCTIDELNTMIAGPQEETLPKACNE